MSGYCMCWGQSTPQSPNPFGGLHCPIHYWPKLVDELREQLQRMTERAETYREEREAERDAKEALGKRLWEARREALEEAASYFEKRFAIESYWWGGLATEAPKPMGKRDVGAQIAAEIRALAKGEK